MMNPAQLVRVRRRLDLSQEHMARVLGVSFASVNRWEGGHSAVTGATLDLYEALDAALRGGFTGQQILQGSQDDRGAFLYRLFRMAYSRRPAKQRNAV